MSTTLNDTMDAARNKMESAKETAKEGTEHAVKNVRSVLLDGIHAVSGVVSIIRGLQLADPLAWIGLTRRQSPLVPLMHFGAGVAVGVGAGMLFAPMSGADMRRTILGRFKAIEQKAEAGAKEIEEKIEEKTGDLAGKAKDAVVSAQHKVEDLAGKAKDTVVNTTEDLAGKAKDYAATAERKLGDIADDTKVGLTSNDPFRKDRENGRPDTTGTHRMANARH